MKIDLVLGITALVMILGSHIWLLGTGSLSPEQVVPHSVINILSGLAFGLAYFLKE